MGLYIPLLSLQSLSLRRYIYSNRIFFTLRVDHLVAVPKVVDPLYTKEGLGKSRLASLHSYVSVSSIMPSDLGLEVGPSVSSC